MPAFHQLRKVKQLGYILFEGVGDTVGVRRLFVIVQSTVVNSDVLLEWI